GRSLWQLREISPGSMFSSGQLDPHFGLGDATNIDLVRIEWPSGIVQTLTNVAPRQSLTITEHQEIATRSIGFTGIERLTNGATRLRVLADSLPGLRVVFEASTNLVNWTRLGTLTNDVEALEFIDSTATNNPRRFYRATAP